MSHFGEIIESTPTYWKVTCWKWDSIPALGSIVIVERDATLVFGIVSYTQTGSRDQARQPFPYQKTEEELQREHPQIYAFLQTICTCVTLGYEQNDHSYYQLPPYSPKIHAFVRHASTNELQTFCAQPHFLQLILAASPQLITPEELILALLKTLAGASLLTPEYLEMIATTFSLLAGNDYRKLKLFLQRAEFLISHH